MRQDEFLICPAMRVCFRIGSARAFYFRVPRAAAATVPLFFLFFLFFFWTRAHLAREFVGRWNISFVRRCDRRFSIISLSGRTRRDASPRVASAFCIRRSAWEKSPLQSRKCSLLYADPFLSKYFFASGLIKDIFTKTCKESSEYSIGIGKFLIQISDQFILRWKAHYFATV